MVGDHQSLTEGCEETEIFIGVDLERTMDQIRGRLQGLRFRSRDELDVGQLVQCSPRIAAKCVRHDYPDTQLARPSQRTDQLQHV